MKWDMYKSKNNFTGHNLLLSIWNKKLGFDLAKQFLQSLQTFDGFTQI